LREDNGAMLSRGAGSVKGRTAACREQIDCPDL
jgi:hypothetical protein